MTADLPQQVAVAHFTLFGVNVKCAVLDNGQRVIYEDSIIALLEAMGASNAPIDDNDFEALVRFLQGRETGHGV